MAHAGREPVWPQQIAPPARSGCWRAIRRLAPRRNTRRHLVPLCPGAGADPCPAINRRQRQEWAEVPLSPQMQHIGPIGGRHIAIPPNTHSPLGQRSPESGALSSEASSTTSPASAPRHAPDAMNERSGPVHSSVNVLPSQPQNVPSVRWQMTESTQAPVALHPVRPNAQTWFGSHPLGP